MNLKKKGLIDLHIHTAKTDGEQSIEDVIKCAELVGMSVIAITDHNCFSITEPLYYKEMLVIPGIEFSVKYISQSYYKKFEIHIIGLFPYGVNASDYDRFLLNLEKGRESYINAIIEELERQGIHITMHEVCNIKKKGTYIGRNDIAKVLVAKGITKTMDEAFDNHIGNRSIHYVNPLNFIEYGSLQEIVYAICLGGGIPILAHPCTYSLGTDGIETLVSNYKKAARDFPGIGIEVYYEKYLTCPEKISFLSKIAHKYSLLKSAGSDHHNAKQPFCSIGSSDLFEKMIDELKKR